MHTIINSVVPQKLVITDALVSNRRPLDGDGPKLSAPLLLSLLLCDLCLFSVAESRISSTVMSLLSTEPSPNRSSTDKLFDRLVVVLGTSVVVEVVVVVVVVVVGTNVKLCCQ